jgi:tetratricopeptide (TPR) repeat protein
MKTKMLLICAMLAMLQAVTLGQKTEVKVNDGLVRVSTEAGEQLVHPGQKACLQEGKSPDVKIDDPIVDDAIALYKIAKEERQNSDENYSLISIQSYAIENNGKAHGGFVTEFTNYRDTAMDLCLLGETIMLHKKQYFSLDGRSLDFQEDKIAPNLGFYYVNYPEEVVPGDAFEFVSTFEVDVDLASLNKGDHYEFTAGEGSPNCLAYYRIVLPEGAEFLECTGDVDLLKIDSHYGRIGLTIKGHRGKSGSHYTIKFNIDDEFLEKPEDDAHNVLKMNTESHNALESEAKKILAESGGDWLKVYDFAKEKEYQWPKGLRYLGIKLIESGNYDQAYDCFQQITDIMNRHENPYALCAIIWQGHLLDMEGKRKEAIEKYQTALDILPRYGRGPKKYDQWGIVLNKVWIEARLKEPFKEEMLEKTDCSKK